MATALAALFLLAFSVYFASRPDYDWDTLAYSAIALRESGTPVTRIHDEAYKALGDVMPPDQFKAVIGHGNVDPEFRHTVASDSNSFLAQLPFYDVKPVYPALMAALHDAGLGLLNSGLAISAAAYFGIGILLYVWFCRWMSPFVAFGTMALFVLNPFLVLLARNIGPDILSLFTLLLGVYLAIERDRPVASALVFVASIAVRPENLIFAGVFLLYLGWIGRLSPSRILLSLAAAGVLYIGLAKLSGNYGWKTLFAYSLVKRSASVSNTSSQLTLLDYLKIYAGRLDRVFMGRGELPMFLLVGFGALCLKARLGLIRDRYAHLVVIAAVLAVARMTILPAEAWRALLLSYMLVTIAFIHACVQLQARATAKLTYAKSPMP